MNKGFVLISLATSALILAGCTQSRLAMDYGTSVKLQKYNQVLNPDAEKNLKPVEGIDGVAASAIVQRYEESFERPAPAPVYVLSFGTPSGGVPTAR